MAQTDLLIDEAQQYSHKNKAAFVKCDKLLIYDYIDLSCRAKMLFLTLKSYIYEVKERVGENSAQEAIAWPGRRKLANDMNCSMKTITNALTELRDCELIVSERRGVGQTWTHRLCIPKPQKNNSLLSKDQ